MAMHLFEGVSLVLAVIILNQTLHAVLEGITFSLYDSIQLMREAGKEITHITSIGGGAKVNFGFKCKLIFSMHLYVN